MRRNRLHHGLLYSLCLSVVVASAGAQTLHWVGTWAASPNVVDNPKGPLGSVDATVRNIVHTSVGGDKFRVVVTNEFGASALTVREADVALSAGGSQIRPETVKALTFSGATSVVIPAGAKVFSDPVPVALAAGSDLVVSLFLPEQPLAKLTQHQYANSSQFIALGNAVAAEKLGNAIETDSWDFLSAIEVFSHGSSIVTLGDSITDGAVSKRGGNLRWPDDLARRLQANPKTADVAVLNEGIGGNRILHDGNGPNALARFDRDVLSQAGVQAVILLEGVNDIGVGTRPENPVETVSATDLILGMTQLIERAHTHGIKIYGATIMPFKGLGFYYTAAGEAERQSVNAWIRSSKLFDGVIDLAKVVEDPADPQRLLPLYDGGDHIHPSDAGHKAMADAVDLSWFSR